MIKNMQLINCGMHNRVGKTLLRYFVEHRFHEVCQKLSALYATAHFCVEVGRNFSCTKWTSMSLDNDQ